MKQLQQILKKEKANIADESKASNFSTASIRGITKSEKWSLDPDILQNSKETIKRKEMEMIKSTLQQRFFSEKYLEEETFQDIITDLTQSLSEICPISSELNRLMNIEQALEEMSQHYLGQIKNSIKQFQSLLDVRIRKLKKKQKKNDLLEYDKIVTKQKMMKKSEVHYINEDADDKEHIKRKENRIKKGEKIIESSKRSYGTMNSGSNENESGGSGKNKSGSESKSGEANALAVLLANVDRPQEKKIPEKINDSYDFSAVMSASMTVRQRNSNKNSKNQEFSKLTGSVHELKEMIEKKNTQKESKDEAFIFHRPKEKRKL